MGGQQLLRRYFQSSFISSVFTSLSAGVLQEGGVAGSTAPHTMIFQAPAGGNLTFPPRVAATGSSHSPARPLVLKLNLYTTDFSFTWTDFSFSWTDFSFAWTDFSFWTRSGSPSFSPFGTRRFCRTLIVIYLLSFSSSW